MSFPIPLSSSVAKKKAELLRSAGTIDDRILLLREDFRINVRDKVTKQVLWRSEAYRDFFAKDFLVINPCSVVFPPYRIEVLLSLERATIRGPVIVQKKIPYRYSNGGNQMPSGRKPLLVSLANIHFQRALKDLRVGIAKQLSLFPSLSLRRGYGPGKP